MKRRYGVILLICSATLAWANSLAEDMIGYWRCDDNYAGTVVRDLSVYEWDGISQRNTNLLSTAGKWRRAFDMSPADPCDYVTATATIYDRGSIGELFQGREIALTNFSNAEHMQDIATDGSYVYTTWTDYLAKHDMYGNLIASANLGGSHYSGIAVYDGMLYLSYFAGPVKRICKYDPADLSYEGYHDVAAAMPLGRGPSGLCYWDGNFYVADATDQAEPNDLRIYKFNTAFQYQAVYSVFEDFDIYGAQTITHFGDKFVIATYDPDHRFVVCNESTWVAEANYATPIIAEGIARLNDNTVLISYGIEDEGLYYGYFRKHRKITYSAPEQAFSMTLWLNCAYLPSELPDPPGATMRIAGISSPQANYALYHKSYAKLYWYLYTTGEGGLSPAPSVAESTGYLVKNIWMHVAFVYNGSTAKIYLDGVERSSVSRSGDIDWTGNTFYLSTSADTRLIGAIDDVRIYARALSPAEVNQIRAQWTWEAHYRNRL